MVETFDSLGNMREIETQRLLLRPLTSADAGFLHQLYSDARVMRWITGKPRTRTETEERLDAHLRQHESFGFGLCAALDQRDRQFVGRCGLEPREESNGMAGELAWMFSPVVWGQGYGTESAAALVEYGLTELKLNRVYATADHKNKASIAIIKRLGMSLLRKDERGVEYELRR